MGSIMKNNKEYLKLQEDFENGKILEEEMTEEQIKGLEALYHEQIDLLHQMKEMYEKKIKYYEEDTKREKTSSKNN